jgi:hypothetical protein
MEWFHSQHSVGAPIRRLHSSCWSVTDQEGKSSPDALGRSAGIISRTEKEVFQLKKASVTVACRKPFHLGFGLTCNSGAEDGKYKPKGTLARLGRTGEARLRYRMQTAGGIPSRPSSEHDSLSSRPLHVPIVPTSVKVPVAPSMLYIETLFETEFVT